MEEKKSYEMRMDVTSKLLKNVVREKNTKAFKFIPHGNETYDLEA